MVMRRLFEGGGRAQKGKKERGEMRKIDRGEEIFKHDLLLSNKKD